MNGSFSSTLRKISNIKRMPEEAQTLYYAAENGYTEVVKILIEKGADINAESFGEETPLWEAASRGHMEIVKFLLEHGAQCTGFYGSIILHCAAQYGDLEVMKTLIEKRKVDINAVSRFNETPLHIAVMHVQIEAVKFLLEHKADTNIQDNAAGTAFQNCVQHENHKDIEEIMRIFLEHGVDIDAVDSNGDTTLHNAVRRGAIETIKMLLEHGADIALTNKEGKTAKELGADNLNIQKLFKAYAIGKDVSQDTTSDLSKDDYLKKEKSNQKYRKAICLVASSLITACLIVCTTGIVAVETQSMVVAVFVIAAIAAVLYYLLRPSTTLVEAKPEQKQQENLFASNVIE